MKTYVNVNRTRTRFVISTLAVVAPVSAIAQVVPVTSTPSTPPSYVAPAPSMAPGTATVGASSGSSVGTAPSSTSVANTPSASATQVTAPDLAGSNVRPSDVGLPLAPGTDVTTGAQPLTLADAIRAARVNTPAVIAQIASASVAEAQIAQARATYYPTVTGSTSANVLISNSPVSTSVGTGGTGTGTGGTGTGGTGTGTGGTALVTPSGLAAYAYLDASLGLRWTIWDFGRTVNNVAVATNGARAARQDVHTAQLSAIASVAGAFFTVLADQELVASQEQTVRQRDRELGISVGLVQAGTRAPIEQTRSEVALDSARLDLANSQAAVLTDLAQLSAAIAIEPTRIVRPVALETAIEVNDDPAEAARIALATRPEILSARLRIEQAESQLAYARAGYNPSLTTSVTGTVRYTDYFVSPNGGANSGLGESANASVALSVPIFDPTIPAGLHVAEANLALARSQLETQSLSVRSNAVVSAVAVRTATQTLAQAERLAAGANANLQQAEGRYAAGAAQLLELVDAEGADATARVAVIRARFQRDLARVRLLAAVGRLDVLESMR